MRLIAVLITIAVLGYGAYWVTKRHPEVKTQVEQLFDSGRFHTLEVRFTAEQLMNRHRNELLKDNRHRYLAPVLEFYPYILMEVKYTTLADRTNETAVLWDLSDGEMVLNTKQWEKTHGFGDCINADAQSHEFKIISLLAKRGGSIDREALSKTLQVEHDVLDSWIESCRRKKLIIQSGNAFRLHFQNPKLKLVPETTIDEWLVTKPYKEAVRLPRRYSAGQIERMAKAAFGQNFAIRRTTDVYLPVHSITVQNPDGSIHTTHWNALNGKRLSQSSFVD